MRLLGSGQDNFRSLLVEQAASAEFDRMEPDHPLYLFLLCRIFFRLTGVHLVGKCSSPSAEVSRTVSADPSPTLGSSGHVAPALSGLIRTGARGIPGLFGFV